MFPNHSHTEGHFQRNPHERNDELINSTTGYGFIFAVQTEYGVDPDNVEPSSAEHTIIGTASTWTMAITTPSDRNGIGCPSYNTNNMASNDTYDTPVAPPAIPRIRAIELPRLSANIPIQIHTLITYRPSVVLMYWNMSLPPSTARLVTNVGFRGPWFRDAAAVPVVSSIAVRMRGVSRPVIIFPVEAGRPVGIIDILRGVYNATGTEVLENETGVGGAPAYGAYEPSSREVSFDDSIAADAIQRHFHNRVWWWGLSPSINEADVWVLHLRGLSRGSFRPFNLLDGE